MYFAGLKACVWNFVGYMEGVSTEELAHLRLEFEKSVKEFSALAEKVRRDNAKMESEIRKVEIFCEYILLIWDRNLFEEMCKSFFELEKRIASCERAWNREPDSDLEDGLI